MEVLVTVGIIAVLCGLAYGGYAMAMQQARKTKEIGAARALVTAYLDYPADHNGELMPGYLPGASVLLPTGERVSGPTAERYPWRMVEYSGLDVRETMMLNPDRQGSAVSGSNYHYMVSLVPSLGLNAYCLGGYRTTTGMIAKKDCVATLAQLSSAQSSNIVVFVSAQLKQGDSVLEGNFLVKPPTMSATDNIHYRHGGKAVAAYIDGHVETNTEEELKDARRWSAYADSDTYRVRP